MLRLSVLLFDDGEGVRLVRWAVWLGLRRVREMVTLQLPVAARGLMEFPSAKGPRLQALAL